MWLHFAGLAYNRLDMQTTKPITQFDIYTISMEKH